MTLRLLLGLLLLTLAGCTAGTEGTGDAPADTSSSPADAEATAPADPSSSEDAPQTASDSLSEDEAREVLRTVYRPIHAFYQESAGSDGTPPEGMRTPDALMDTLTQTMAPEVARSFTDQLLMQREDGYIVRPTEKIITPYEGSGPALEAVTVTRNEGGGYVLTERYAKTQLYGRVERENVVRRKGDGWYLVSIRR